MKLNLKDTLVLSAGVGGLLACIALIINGHALDAYFPGILAVGFFLWFLYRKGGDYKDSQK